MKSIERQKNLLQDLLATDDYVPARYFADKYDVSSKTIYNDFDKISESIKGSKIAIEKSPRHGVRLVGKVNDRLTYIKNYNLDQKSLVTRLDRIVQILMFEQKTVSYEYLSAELYVSVSSIRKDIERLQKFFVETNAKIISTSTGTKVIGPELDIQRVLRKYVIYQSYKNDVGINLVNRIDSVVSAFVEDTNIVVANDMVKYCYGSTKISNYYIDNFSISLKILLQRLKAGRHVDIIEVDNLEYMDLYLFALELVEAINVSLNVKFYDDDIKYLASLMYAYGVKPINKKEIPIKDIQSVKYVIKKMSNILDVDLEYDIKLYNSLTYHFTAMIYRLKSNITVRNPLLNDIKKEYSVLFRLVWYVFGMIESEYNVKFNDDEISFLTIYFQIALEKIDTTFSVFIVCQIGLSTSELIYNKVKNIFSQNDVIKVISFDELNEEVYQNADIIITSILLDKEEDNIFYVSPLITKEEMSKISSYYLSMAGDKSTIDVNKSVTKDVNYHKFIDRDLIFMNYDFKTKFEIIDFINNELLENKAVTEGFKTSVLDRESKGLTSISTGVAIPHAMPSTVIHTSIVMMTLKNEINWDGNKVRFILLLAVNDVDIDSIKLIMTNFYSKIENKETVNELVESTTKTELIDKFVSKKQKNIMNS